MITRDGHAKILDFGLAKLIEPLPMPAGDSSGVATAVLPHYSTPGTVMGTVGYMSPEQAQGKTKEIDQRSDIFSFACILFEAVTGKKPFEGESVIKSLHMVIYEPAPLLADLKPTAPSEGSPKQITNFTSESIRSFDLSRDGKQIAVSRGTSTSDVVLVSGIKK
jgi:serine/threonine protein kinase